MLHSLLIKTDECSFISHLLSQLNGARNQGATKLIDPETRFYPSGSGHLSLKTCTMCIMNEIVKMVSKRSSVKAQLHNC